MKYLADTSIIVDHLRGVTGATDFLLNKRPSISIVTVAELIQGAKDKSEQKVVEKISASLNTIPISEVIGRKAILFMKQFFLSNRLQFLDALIAATAVDHKLILVTANTKHFASLRELKLIDWKELKAKKVKTSPET